MFFVVILMSVMFLALIWGLVGGALYRRPWTIAVLGVVVGVSGLYMSSNFSAYEKIPELMQLFPDISNGKEAITILISSLSGSLFASAIILQSQNVHNRELATAVAEIESAKEFLLIAEKNDKILKEKAKEMNVEEFWVKYKIIRDQEFNAVLKILKAEEKRKKLQP